MAIQAETAIDAPFQDIVDDEIKGRQLGYLIAPHGGRASVGEMG